VLESRPLLFFCRRRSWDILGETLFEASSPDLSL